MKSIPYTRHLLPIFCACLILSVATAAFGQTTRVLIDEFQVGKFVTDVQSAMNIPSVAVGIVGAERSYFFETYGPAGHEEPFAIASLSKSVTAMAVMLLVQDEKLAIDDPASKWVDGVPQGVTVRDLLHHRSGLDDGDDVLGWRKNDLTLEELVGRASWAGTRGEFSYSTLNYQILGTVVEKASEQPYGAFVKERIFEPAGMTTAHAGPEPPSTYVRGHKYVFGYPFSEGDARYGAPAMASDFVWMSARDMETWIRLFTTGGKLEKKQIIPEAVMEALLQTEGTSPYGMGWFVGDEEGLKVARNTGGTGSFSASMAVVPERKIGVFVLTNVNSWNGYAPESILAGLLASVLERGGGSLSNYEFVLRFAVGVFLLLTLLAFLLEVYKWVSAHRPMKLDSRARSRILVFTAIVCALPIAPLLYFDLNPLYIFAIAPDVGFGLLAMIILQVLRRLISGFNKTVLRRVDALVDKFA